MLDVFLEQWVNLLSGAILFRCDVDLNKNKESAARNIVGVIVDRSKTKGFLLDRIVPGEDAFSAVPPPAFGGGFFIVCPNFSDCVFLYFLHVLRRLWRENILVSQFSFV
jgi:hypothetical protein